MSKKPEQTEEAKKNFRSPILDILRTTDGHRWTYEELQEASGLSKRQVRQELSNIAMHYAVLFNSGEKGFRLSRDTRRIEMDFVEMKKEVDEIDLSLADIESRKNILSARERALIAAKVKITREMSNATIQPNLFDYEVWGKRNGN